jgi:hypothetical protein
MTSHLSNKQSTSLQEIVNVRQYPEWIPATPVYSSTAKYLIALAHKIWWKFSENFSILNIPYDEVRIWKHRCLAGPRNLCDTVSIRTLVSSK